ILDRHKRAENGRHGFSGHRADTLHLWNNHRAEYVSELSGFETQPTNERNCERHTGGDYRHASGTTLSRSCANRYWGAELRSSNLRSRDLASVRTAVCNVSTSDLFRRVLQVLAAGKIRVRRSHKKHKRHKVAEPTLCLLCFLWPLLPKVSPANKA